MRERKLKPEKTRIEVSPEMLKAMIHARVAEVLRTPRRETSEDVLYPRREALHVDLIRREENIRRELADWGFETDAAALEWFYTPGDDRSVLPTIKAMHLSAKKEQAKTRHVEWLITTLDRYHMLHARIWDDDATERELASIQDALLTHAPLFTAAAHDAKRRHVAQKQAQARSTNWKGFDAACVELAENYFPRVPNEAMARFVWDRLSGDDQAFGETELKPTPEDEAKRKDKTDQIVLALARHIRTSPRFSALFTRPKATAPRSRYRKRGSR